MSKFSIAEKAEKWKEAIYTHPSTFLAMGGLFATIAFSKIMSFYNRILSRNTVLEVDLSEVSLIKKSPGLFDSMNSLNFNDLLDTITLASKKPSVVGLIFNFGSSIENLSYSDIIELREVILSFNKQKKSVCFTETFTLQSYFLASAFTEIYLIDRGIVAIQGMIMNAQFIKGTLDKLHVETKVYQREKYKNFGNFFSEDKLTEQHKENLQKYMQSVNDTVKLRIQSGRNVSMETVQNWVDEGLFSCQAAALSKIVDGYGSVKTIYKNAYRLFGVTEDNVNLLYSHIFYKIHGPLYPPLHSYFIWTITKFAVISLSGTIHDGPSRDGTIGADTARMIIRSAIMDPSISAIIIKVNSGGGGVSASQTINNEILAAKEAGKKVVVFMQGVAASGGYMISMNANKIICTSATITGSIGVIGVQMNTRNLWGKYFGITFDDVQSSKSSEFFSNIHPILDGSHRDQKMNQLIDCYYSDFKDDVAKARNISRQNMDVLAQGKIYSGEDAVLVGLVDKVGTFSTAVEEAKLLVGLTADAPVELITFPKQLSLMAMLRNFNNPPKNSEEKTKRGAPSLEMGLNSSYGFLSIAYNKVMSLMTITSAIERNPVVSLMEPVELE